MNEIDERGKLTSQGRQRIIRDRMAMRDRWIEEWHKERDKGNSILTENNIDFLGVLVEKNLTGKSLNSNQGSMKKEIHQKFRNAFSDINRMINNEIIGKGGFWNPEFVNQDGKNRYPYDPEIWREDFPLSSVSSFVECLVNLYGDEYAVPIAESIRKGLVTREGWDSKFEVDVPILRRSRSNK